MTSQTLFDTIVRHLYTQKKRAADETGRCLYRAPGGLKCVVGCLIPDEKYKPEMDGDGYSLANALRDAGIPLLQHRLLGELRLIHDDSHVWSERGPNASMVCHLKRLAKAFNLNAAVLIEVTA